jgi:hypothetical protein
LIFALVEERKPSDPHALIEFSSGCSIVERAVAVAWLRRQNLDLEPVFREGARNVREHLGIRRRIRLVVAMNENDTA